MSVFEPPSQQTSTPPYMPGRAASLQEQTQYLPAAGELPDPPPNPPAPRGRRRWPWLILAAVALLAAGVGGGLYLSGGGQRAELTAATPTATAQFPSIGAACPINSQLADGVNGAKLRCEANRWASADPPAPELFAVAGMFTVTDATCKGIERGKNWGYKDIPGSEVRVMTAGRILGVTNLDEKGITLDKGSCTYAFRIEGVEAGHDFYSVEVGRRGEITYTEDELRDILDLTIGD